MNSSLSNKGIKIFSSVLLSAVLLSVSVFLYARYVKAAPANPETVPESIPEQVEAEVSRPSVPLFAEALLRSYPDFVKGYEDGALLFADGTSLICDDGRQKDFLMRVEDTDIEDMFFDKYREGDLFTPDYLKDPGRYRCDAFFKKMYGATEAEARQHLVPVDWFGQSLKFTSVNHAADSLRAVARDLKALSPLYDKYFPQSSTFNWRPVRGTSRMSPHSYGIAIDLCVKHSNYWRWGNPGKSEVDHIDYANKIPGEIVEIFEKHGFISGVKWYHYDTMHFEFRPEILYFSKR